MKLIEFSTRRPVSIFIFAVAAVVFGVVAFRDLATDLLPDITYPSLTVQTTYDGAAPIEIESLVTRPVENAVGVVNSVTRVASSSRADVSEVTLEFAWGTNMDLAALDVRERLDVLVGFRRMRTVRSCCATTPRSTRSCAWASTARKTWCGCA